MAAFLDLITDMLTFTFTQRALIVGMLISLCAALLGVNLVLKRYAMIGTALGNVGFLVMAMGGVVEFAALGDPGAIVLFVAAAWGSAPVLIPLVLITLAAFIMLRIREKSKTKGDSVVAVVSTGSIALGVIITELTTGLSLHICNVMFGSIFALSSRDVPISIGLSIAVVGVFIFFYKQLFAVTHDENFAKATGTKVEVYKSLLAILTAVTVVMGMRLMGAMLIAALTVFPALIALQLFKRFLSVVIGAAVIGVACFFIGLMLSFGLEMPPGACVVGVNLAVYVIVYLIGFVRRKIGV